MPVPRLGRNNEDAVDDTKTDEETDEERFEAQGSDANDSDKKEW
jgi:hypothetical protein